MQQSSSTFYTYFTPAGPITVAANGRAITRVVLGRVALSGAQAPSELTNLAATQIQEYLARKRTTFNLPLAEMGTPFQQQAWKALANVPYAQTVTAADLASRIGHAGAHRAVGGAERANPVALVVPTQRRVRAKGQPRGEGKPVRAALLRFEQQG